LFVFIRDRKLYKIFLKLFHYYTLTISGWGGAINPFA
jgi:hypothetical protein